MFPFKYTFTSGTGLLSCTRMMRKVDGDIFIVILFFFFGCISIFIFCILGGSLILVLGWLVGPVEQTTGRLVSWGLSFQTLSFRLV
jgi:hypothetical protein